MLPPRGFSRKLRSALLDSGTGHVSALFRTFAARFGTTSTMVGFVLAAFRTAGVTDIGAHSANVVSELRPPAHERRRRPAKFRTVSIQPNAFGHRLHILFAEAGGGTMFARLRTLDAGSDARLELVVGHIIDPPYVNHTARYKGNLPQPTYRRWRAECDIVTVGDRPI